jgi:diguanylate cyclase (GGDEF)-like protein/PAS domain S-box-containing protein
MTVTDDAFLRFLLASRDAVLIVEDDDDERIIACNARACALFGAKEETLRHRPLRSLLPAFVARASASDIGPQLTPSRFVRDRASIADRSEEVTIAAVRAVSPGGSHFAVFVRAGAPKLEEPWDVEGSEASLRFALESGGIGNWEIDLRSGTISHSRTHDACFGYSQPPPAWDYKAFRSHLHPADRERINSTLRACIAEGRGCDLEFRVVWLDGSTHWLWAKGHFSYDAAGVPIRFAGILVDISERKRVEEGLRLGALAMAATTDAILIADARAPGFPILYANESFERMTGYTSSEIVGKSCRILQGDDTAQPELEDVRAALRAGLPCRTTLRNYRKDGTLYWNQLTLSPLRDAAGTLTHYVGVQSDVTREKEWEAELLHRATHDTLTGLPTQELLEDRLELALRDAERDGTFVAVAILDIDRLKRVNDSLGHAGGDVLIKALASRLRGAVRARDTVARYGGDEFAIVFRDLENLESAERSIARLHDAVAVLLVVGDIEFTPSASVGVALYPRDGGDVDRLIRVADTAMYAAKAAERGSVRFFDGASMGKGADDLALEGAMKRGLAAGEFALDYQPIYDARTGNITGLEALLRWRRPGRGCVPPGDFIPLAEVSGLIVPIGEWVLREICRQHHAWAALGLPLVPIAVNVSIVQLRRPDFCAMFGSILADAKIEPNWIVLEITESVFMDDVGLFAEQLNALRALGVRVAIDDFGTGFSSLAYLKRLAADDLKIDKSFVDDITRDPSALAIAQAIVTLAHSVGLCAIAEGVESHEQATLLRSIGCDQLQGFYFARPAGAEATARRLRTERAPAA